MTADSGSGTGTSAPVLTGLTIGSLTLDPVFDAGVTEYSAHTANATNKITATADAGVDIAITVNGSNLANGTSATWESGENTVKVALENEDGTNEYTVTVTKS